MTTIVDVARAAGVSSATVSRVLNNQPQVDPRLVATVLQAVKELGYRPSRVARTLRTRRNRVWALIISDVRTGPFFGEVVRGVEDVAYGAGYSLFLCNSDEDFAKEASYIELAVGENVGGVILTPSGRHTDLSPLVDFDIPVVLADRTLPGVMLLIPVPPVMVLVFDTVAVLLLKLPSVSLLLPAVQIDAGVQCGRPKGDGVAATSANDQFGVGHGQRIASRGERRRICPGSELDAAIGHPGAERDGVGAGASDQRVDVADRAGVGATGKRPLNWRRLQD